MSSEEEIQEVYDYLKEHTGEKEFYKNHSKDKVWWVDTIGVIGLLEVSFDKKNILNLWQDYPHNFTPEQKELFDKENPYWADFFRGRCEEEGEK